MNYGFHVRLQAGFEETVERVIEALQTEGFGLLADMDVAATLKAKIGVDRPPYRILGACNPPLARQAIDAEPDIGLLLPCNVVVRQDGEDVVVAFMDPAAVLGLVGRPELAELGDDVRGRLERVRDLLVDGPGGGA